MFGAVSCTALPFTGLPLTMSGLWFTPPSCYCSVGSVTPIVFQTSFPTHLLFYVDLSVAWFLSSHKENLHLHESLSVLDTLVSTCVPEVQTGSVATEQPLKSSARTAETQQRRFPTGEPTPRSRTVITALLVLVGVGGNPVVRLGMGE